MILGYTTEEYLVQLVSGLGSGGLLFLVAAGLSLIFGAMRIINFAHGSLFMLGAYFTMMLTPVFGFGDLTFVITVLAAALMVAAVGMLMEVFFFRPIYTRPLLTQLLVTFAFVFIIAGFVREIWGAGSHNTPEPPFLSGSVSLFGGSLPAYYFFFMGMALAVGGGLWAILYRTQLGHMIRAAVVDPELLGLSGVNVRLLFTGVFVMAAFLAGLGGAVFSFQGSIVLGMDVNAVILAFVIVVIGGMGSLSGAFIASILVGVAQALGTLWVPRASIAIVFIVLVAVLALRPEGLRGTKAP